MLVPAANLTPATQRRAVPRLRTLKAGKIVFNHDFSVFDCVVRNLTERGACLEFGDSVGVPPTFELQLADGARHHCNLIWRYKDRMGVAFH
jgi:hypothetical protein